MERLNSIFQRLGGYSWPEVGVELLIIGIFVYAVVKFVEGTRAAAALKGLLVLVVAMTVLSRVVGGAGSFQRLGLLYDRFLTVVTIALIVIFQPELRRALVRLSETSFIRSTPKDIAFVVGEIADAAKYLSRAKFGAIIVIERQTPLGGLVEGGTVLNASLSSRLIQTIFFPGSALHDLAVIVNGKTLRSAGVQLPLAEPGDMPDPSFGSRHRAAVGLSKECDALVVVVSEETGQIRIAERGRLSEKGLTPEELREELEAKLRREPVHHREAGADPAHESGPEPAPGAEEQPAFEENHR